MLRASALIARLLPQITVACFQEETFRHLTSAEVVNTESFSDRDTLRVLGIISQEQQYLSYNPL